jgi:hypothetical protein
MFIALAQFFPTNCSGTFAMNNQSPVSMKTKKALEINPQNLRLAGESWLAKSSMNEQATQAVLAIEWRFTVDHVAACLIAALFAVTERKSNLDEREIRERFEKEALQADWLGLLKDLEDFGWVNVVGESRRSGKEYVLSAGFVGYLKTGDEGFLEYCDEPAGDSLINECLSWHRKGWLRGSRHEVRGFQPLDTLINHHHHPMVRYLRKQCTDLRQQAAALFILGHEITHHTAVGINELLEELFRQPLPHLIAQASWQNPRSDVYKNDVLVPSLVVDKKVLEVSLSESFKKRFLPAQLRKTRSTGNITSPYFQIIRPEHIAPVSLIYPSEFKQDIDNFLGHLAPGRLDGYLRDLRSLGMRPAMTIMLYGAPGTGKTELVQQLARQHNRVLLLVNLQSLREMWFGQSERNVSALFDSLRWVASQLSQPPIVLFNEADGFFHQRSKKDSQSNQTENTMITLFLNELERFEGILFGTSNHPESMDPAFERRWAIKMHVPLPDESVRVHLLKIKLKGLFTTPNLPLLARKYAFTPAQLDNVVRKFLLLSSADRSMDFLDRLLAQETNGWQGSLPRIGF